MSQNVIVVLDIAAPSVLRFERPSRSGGAGHLIYLDSVAYAPIDPERPCSCPAGMASRFCWALLEVLSNDVPHLTNDPDVLARSRIAAAMLAERQKKGSPAS
jgi:hypothetical protein